MEIMASRDRTVFLTEKQRFRTITKAAVPCCFPGDPLRIPAPPFDAETSDTSPE